MPRHSGIPRLFLNFSVRIICVIAKMTPPAMLESCRSWEIVPLPSDVKHGRRYRQEKKKSTRVAKIVIVWVLQRRNQTRLAYVSATLPEGRSLQTLLDIAYPSASPASEVGLLIRRCVRTCPVLRASVRRIRAVGHVIRCPVSQRRHSTDDDSMTPTPRPRPH